VLSGGDDGTVVLWSTSTGKPVRTFQGHEGCINQVLMSRCGRYAYSASSDQTIKKWDVANGRCLGTFEGSEGRVTGISLSGDGTELVSCSDVFLYGWNAVRTGQCLRSFQGHAPVSLSRDGQFAISCGTHGEFKVWAVHIVETPFPAQFVLCKGV
jgi:WD40 repeat protein